MNHWMSKFQLKTALVGLLHASFALRPCTRTNARAASDLDRITPIPSHAWTTSIPESVDPISNPSDPLAKPLDLTTKPTVVEGKPTATDVDQPSRQVDSKGGQKAM
jgi:hypothetical protein